nr:hypothetical protein KitaXyl93_02750 [Kitasatospora sp. Xyl93]
MAGEEQADDDPERRQDDGSDGVDGLPGGGGAGCGHAKRLPVGKEVDGGAVRVALAEFRWQCSVRH